eukprot:3217662-Lingulodinium_polyedra.AAC.1
MGGWPPPGPRSKRLCPRRIEGPGPGQGPGPHGALREGSELPKACVRGWTQPETEVCKRGRRLPSRRRRRPRICARPAGSRRQRPKGGRAPAPPLVLPASRLPHGWG